MEELNPFQYLINWNKIVINGGAKASLYFFNMKSKEIIQQATDNLSDGVRENILYLQNPSS